MTATVLGCHRGGSCRRHRDPARDAMRKAANQRGTAILGRAGCGETQKHRGRCWEHLLISSRRDPSDWINKGENRVVKMERNLKNIPPVFIGLQYHLGPLGFSNSQVITCTLLAPQSSDQKPFSFLQFFKCLYTQECPTTGTQACTHTAKLM